MGSGGLCVMMAGTKLTQMWPVGSLDILVLSVLTMAQVAL